MVTLNTDTPVYEEFQFIFRPDLLGKGHPSSEQKYLNISRIKLLWLTTRTLVVLESTLLPLSSVIVLHISWKNSSALWRISSSVSSK